MEKGYELNDPWIVLIHPDDCPDVESFDHRRLYVRPRAEMGFPKAPEEEDEDMWVEGEDGAPLPYRLLVLGGSHRWMAKWELLLKCPELFHLRLSRAIVYAGERPSLRAGDKYIAMAITSGLITLNLIVTGLTPDEALTIAAQHNVDNEFRMLFNNYDRIMFIHQSWVKWHAVRSHAGQDLDEEE